MPTDIYWIDALDGHSLAILARPRPGDWLQDEIAAWQREGVNVVVSMLEPFEAQRLGLTDEERFCREVGLEFVSFPIADVSLPPSFESVLSLVQDLRERLGNGRSVGAHCRAGIGRSSMIAASVLVASGATTAQAFEAITRARGLQVPDTPEQRAWVEGFERRLRDGGAPLH